MKTYSSMSNARRSLRRIGELALANANRFISRTENGFEVDLDAAAKLQQGDSANGANPGKRAPAKPQPQEQAPASNGLRVPLVNAEVELLRILEHAFGAVQASLQQTFSHDEALLRACGHAHCEQCGGHLGANLASFFDVANAQDSAAAAFELIKHQWFCMACGYEWGKEIKLVKGVVTNVEPCYSPFKVAARQPSPTVIKDLPPMNEHAELPETVKFVDTPKIVELRSTVDTLKEQRVELVAEKEAAEDALAGANMGDKPDAEAVKAAEAKLKEAEKALKAHERKVTSAENKLAKELDREQERQEKAAAKAAEQAEKEALKAAKQAEREKAKAEREAAKAAKLAEQEAKKAEREAAKAAAAEKREKSKMPEQNGQRMPKPGTIGSRLWEIFDTLTAKKGSTVSIAEALEVADAEGIAQLSTRAGYAHWRKFHGISGRVPAPKPEAPEAPAETPANNEAGA